LIAAVRSEATVFFRFQVELKRHSSIRAGCWTGHLWVASDPAERCRSSGYSSSISGWRRADFAELDESGKSTWGRAAGQQTRRPAVAARARQGAVPTGHDEGFGNVHCCSTGIIPPDSLPYPHILIVSFAS